MKSKIQITLGVLVIAALLVWQTPHTTASQQPSPSVNNSAPAQATPAAGGDVYTLGVVMPFTGDLGQYGKGFNEGIELAVEQMNAQLAAAGRSLSFKTVSQDTGGTPDGAAKALQTVVQSSGAQVVVGPLSTSEVLGAKQYADQNKIVILAPASTGVSGAIPNDYIFRLFDPPDSFAGQAFLGIAAARGYKNLVVLYVDDPFGTGLIKSFADPFKAAASGEVSEVKYPTNAADLSSEMTKVSSEVARLSASGSTAFFCACFLGDAQKALKIASVDPNMGKVDWLGVENLYAKDMLADKDQAAFLGSVHFTAVSTASISNPNTQPFIDAYKAKFSKEPGPFTNFAYDAANVAMLSMIAAGNNGAAVQKIVPFIADHYVGTQVQSYLDANGDQAIAYYTLYQVKPDGSDFAEIGSFDGSTGKVTFTTK